MACRKDDIDDDPSDSPFPINGSYCDECGREGDLWIRGAHELCDDCRDDMDAGKELDCFDEDDDNIDDDDDFDDEFWDDDLDDDLDDLDDDIDGDDTDAEDVGEHTDDKEEA